MVHNFINVLQLRAELGKLDSTQLLEWSQFLFSTDFGHNIFLRAIFRELYRQGDNNDEAHLLSLLSECKRLQSNNNVITDQVPEKQETKDSNASQPSPENEWHTDFMSECPRAILSQIGSYLSTKDLFARWSRVSRLFTEISLSTETIEHFEFNSRVSHENSPKFSLKSVIKHVKSLVFRPRREEKYRCKRLLDLNNTADKLCRLQSLQMISNCQILQKFSTLVAGKTAILKRISVDDDLDGVSRLLLQSSRNLEKIELRMTKSRKNVFHGLCQTDADDIIQFLVPLSPENYEIEKLKKEQLHGLQNKLSKHEVEEIEAKIEEQVRAKYLKLDDREWSGCEWKQDGSSIRMIAIENGLNHDEDFEQLLDKQLTGERIRSSLGNLEALALHGRQRYFLYQVFKRIVQTRGLKVFSLHLQNNTYMPHIIADNLTELCLKLNHQSIPILSNVNIESFKKLKHIRVEMKLKGGDNEKLIEKFCSNLKLFVANNKLESLHLVLDGLKLVDIFQEKSYSSDLSESGSGSDVENESEIESESESEGRLRFRFGKPDDEWRRNIKIMDMLAEFRKIFRKDGADVNVQSKAFVFRLNVVVHANFSDPECRNVWKHVENKEFFQSVEQIMLLYRDVTSYFESAMFAFKMQIKNDTFDSSEMYRAAKLMEEMKEFFDGMVKNDQEFSSNGSVHDCVVELGRNLLYAFVNKTKREGKNDRIANIRHSESMFTHCCRRCKQGPWLALD